MVSHWTFLIITILLKMQGYNADIILEEEHDPALFTSEIPRIVNGSELPDLIFTPDYRLEEPPWRPYEVHNVKWKYMEEERPYRMSPFFKQAYSWNYIYNFWTEAGNPDDPFKLGCYCTTVYKRLTVLAGCAVLTARHILTTATSTELIIRDRRDDMTLEGILGAWYDIDSNVYNSSVYTTPARIHYHPRYLRLNNINISHPLPVYYDLAIWATVANMHAQVCYCSRANSGWWKYASTYPEPTDYVIVVGFQYIKSMKKRPLPWFKYAVKTRAWLTCPKQDWGWFHCLVAKLWGKYGIESGAAWHRAGRKLNWMTDGLAAMCSFSMRLRSDEIVHYFTVLNTHRVLDWMYDAYNGWLPYEYLDKRYYDNQGSAPVGKDGYNLLEYSHPVEGVQDYIEPPYYK